MKALGVSRIFIKVFSGCAKFLFHGAAARVNQNSGSCSSVSTLSKFFKDVNSKLNFDEGSVGWARSISLAILAVRVSAF